MFSGTSGAGKAKVQRSAGIELAGEAPAVQFRSVGARPPRPPELLRVGVDPDRVLLEFPRRAHPLGRCGPVAEVVGLQLDAVSVRIQVVQGGRQPVIKAGVRNDLLLPEPLVGAEQPVDAVVLEREVVHPGVSDLVRVVAQPRDGEQRHAVVGAVVGQPGAVGVVVVGSHAQPRSRTRRPSRPGEWSSSSHGAEPGG